MRVIVGVRAIGVFFAAVLAGLVLAVVVSQTAPTQRVGQLVHSLSARVAISVPSVVIVGVWAIGVILVALFRLPSRFQWAWRIIARHVLVLHDCLR